jgi:SAM-dependent methyltransferase
MKAFSGYARYYDLLYQDKDYAEESRFVMRQLHLFNCEPSTILELGCGTGRHASEMAQLGVSVSGVDLSADMVSVAQIESKRLGVTNTSFEVGDVRSYRRREKFGAVVSLFHVMSYQISDEDLRETFVTAAEHLEKGGFFFFDFWFGPAVMADPPEKRLKQMENEFIRVKRTAVPHHDKNSETVTVLYNISIEDRETGEVEVVAEEHKLRYMFPKQLGEMAIKGGFILEKLGSWMSEDEPTERSWYAWAICRKQ